MHEKAWSDRKRSKGRASSSSSISRQLRPSEVRHCAVARAKTRTDEISASGSVTQARSGASPRLPRR
jgi:hypothetical protein